MTAQASTLGLAALAGLALGSYAVTAAVRFARAEPSAVGRSHCDSCGQMLTFSQTVPLLSYIRARGSCMTCQVRIDPIHLVGELSGLLVVLTAFLVPDLVRTPILAVLGLLLIAASAIDWKIGRLPDVLTGAVAAMALLLSSLKSLAALEAGLFAAVIGFVLLQGLRWAAVKLRKDAGLGLGDVKLICALAVWLGVAAPWMVVGAAVAGLALMAIVRPSDGRLAFGPALAAGGWIVGIGGEWGYWPTTL
jgi:leader peptidase (prepilin peptidase) / N-methyltransferase